MRMTMRVEFDAEKVAMPTLKSAVEAVDKALKISFHRANDKKEEK